MGLAIFALLVEGMFALGAIAAIVVLFVGLKKHWVVASALSAAVVAAYFWSLFPTARVYDDLCRTRAGEKIYQRVNASSYFLAGEANDNYDRIGLASALQDVLDRRAEFVELVKLSDPAQRQVLLLGLARRAGIDVRQAKAFRLWIGEEASSPCAVRYSEALAQAYFYKGRLKEGECVAMAALEAPTSPYGVELLLRRPVWFTPEITEFGVRVFEAKQNRTLGEFSAFEQLPRPLVVLVMNDKPLRCPQRRSSVDLPMQLTPRNVLLSPR